MFPYLASWIPCLYQAKSRFDQIFLHHTLPFSSTYTKGLLCSGNSFYIVSFGLYILSLSVLIDWANDQLNHQQSKLADNRHFHKGGSSCTKAFSILLWSPTSDSLASVSILSLFSLHTVPILFFPMAVYTISSLASYIHGMRKCCDRESSWSHDFNGFANFKPPWLWKKLFSEFNLSVCVYFHLSCTWMVEQVLCVFGIYHGFSTI